MLDVSSSRSNRLKVFLFLISLLTEAVAYFLLIKTYSRGAFVAFIVSALFTFLSMRAWRSRARSSKWGLRSVLVVGLLVLNNFEWARVNQPATIYYHSVEKPSINKEEPTPFFTSDRSIANRLELWLSGMRMTAAALYCGWGAGESGTAYMNWFQGTDDEKPYKTMVNSYLQILVEHGVLVFSVAAGAVLWFLLCGLPRVKLAYLPIGGFRLYRAPLSASVVSWLIANCFSSLWLNPWLWSIPSLCALAHIFFIDKLFNQTPISQPCFTAEGGASARFGKKTTVVAQLVLNFALCCFGVFSFSVLTIELTEPSASNESFSVRKDGDSILLESVSRHDNGTGDLHFWTDSKVLGKWAGKEIRRLSSQLPGQFRIYVHKNVQCEIRFNDACVLMGRHSSRLGLLQSFEPRIAVVIHPLTPPPSIDIVQSAAVSVVLPEIDESGLNAAWREWARSKDIDVVESSGCGIDIRPIWPAMFVDLQHRIKRRPAQ